MTVSERTVGDVAILKVDGQLTLGRGADMLCDRIAAVLQRGQRRILVDLAEVPYMDSAGLGYLVQSFTTVTNQGGTLALVNVTDRLRDLLVITKLVTVFNCYDSEAAGLAGVGAKR